MVFVVCFTPDDSQLYVIIKPSERASMIARLEACIRDIRLLLSDNKLMLNDGKTEILHVRSRYAKNVPEVTITIGDATISPTADVRNLGVMYDDNLTMTSHVNNVCRSASFGIHWIGKLRRYLDPDNTKKLMHAFVSSRLDSCNSVLAGLPDKELDKLQLVQNAAARVVTPTKKIGSYFPGHVLASLASYYGKDCLQNLAVNFQDSPPSGFSLSIRPHRHLQPSAGFNICLSKSASRTFKSHSNVW